MKFFRRGENVEKLSEEEKKRRAKEFVKALFEDFGKNYLNVDYDNINTYENTRENPARSGERREGNMKAPENRDEILLEILKELRELNSNVKAVIVRMDTGREEMRQLAKYLAEELDRQFREISGGMGGW